MKRSLRIVAALGSAAISLSGATAAQPDARIDAFHKLLSEQWEHQLQANPEAATLLGDRRYNDRWTDASLAHARSERGATAAFLKRFAAVDTTGFSSEDKLSHLLMVRQLRTTLKGFDLKLYEMPIYQWRSSTPLALPTYAADFPFDTVRDYDDYITRLKRIPTVLDQTVEVARQGQRDKLIPPAYLLKKLVARIDGLVAPSGTDSIFAQPLTRFPAGIPSAARDRISTEMVTTIEEVVRPAYRRFNRFLANDYAPHGRAEPGLWSLPNGDAIYRYLAEQQTTTTQSPEHMHKVGLAEVSRIEAEMTLIAKGQGFSDLTSFRAALKTDPSLHASSREDMLNRYRSFIAQMKPMLPKLFGTLPRTDLVVVPVPTFLESAAPIADYHQGTPDGSQPGRVYVNTANFETRSTLLLESAAYHEGVPGHHLQFSIAQLLPGLPPFRQQADYTAYIEGWALYAELVGKEVGFYKDPLSDYGRLSSELLRADRLAIDTGVHFKRWTRQQMVDFFHAHSGEDETQIQAEVDRFISIPAQALSYKIGELEILELRERARSRLGNRFDIRDFHDRIIGDGALPLDVLETRIDAWIAGTLTTLPASPRKDRF
ncbi:DUF885 family protein [Sphingomonas sp. QA11]|uniref:DUF885 domain-containing protein n=1 Tax=Sphingomonas sp. QA11 TaxID=2950605 RepID=UPI00234A7320|nr:DUF885 family protein [Sphingomonas sp. QA11]WCM28543.1 DUF885 family protein [Sphingomonas sp. QA11]